MPVVLTGTSSRHRREALLAAPRPLHASNSKMEIWNLLLQWSAPTPEHARWSWRRPIHGCVVGARVVWDALFAFVTEEALIRASSLAFTSLVSLVPLMTVGLRVMNFYGVGQATRQELESNLQQYLLPAQSRDVVNLMLAAASQVTQNIGVAGLL